MPLKFLMDENVAPGYRTGLLRRNPDLIVLAVGEPGVPPPGTLDPDILCWCEDNDFLLVTNNRRSMPQHLVDHLAAGRHVPGILIFNPAEPIGTTLDKLELVASASFEDEYRDTIAYLPQT